MVHLKVAGPEHAGAGIVTVTVPLLATADHPLGGEPGPWPLTVVLTLGLESPGVPSVYFNVATQPAPRMPVHGAVSGAVKAMCGKTWNLAVGCAVAPTASVTLTEKIQSFAGDGNAFLSEKPFSPMPVGIAPATTL